MGHGGIVNDALASGRIGMVRRISRTIGSAVGFLVASVVLLAQPFTYPTARKTDHVDAYHGVAVPDPYRWLEDDNSSETAAWVEAENKVTFAYLNSIPYRQIMHDRVLALNEYAKYSAPSHKGPYFFFNKNEGLQNQSVLYVQNGLNGNPQVLIDPNTLSE